MRRESHPDSLEQRMRCFMHCLLRGKFGIRLGNAHHPAQLQPWQFCHGQGQLQSLFGGHTGFVVAAIHIDLDANVQRRQMRGPLV